ncbi:hypothetical protein BH09ACT6_BH09ACT6_24990 [soil metagenome]
MQDSSDGLVSGRFRLGDLLGSGGSASVFDAVDVSSGEDGTHVALKILHPHLSRSPAAREAFFTEARAAENLRHPNIVAVLGVGVHDPDGEPLAWIALERAPGTTLAELCESSGALTVASTLVVADGVLRALEAAHAVGLVHRDVSPANIMVELDSDGRVQPEGVRLVDFGLADAAGRPVLGSDILRSTRPASDSAAPLGVLGSANYMSPEQALGEPVDERGDVYQVGAVVYFALTGRPPFVRDSTSAVMRAHVKAPPPVPSVLYSGIPRAVDRLVVKALLKDPASRYPSAAAMREAVLLLQASVAGSTALRTVIQPPAGTATTRMIAMPPSARRRSPGTPGPPGTPRAPAVRGAALGAAAAPAIDPPQPAPVTAAPAFAARRERGGGAVWAAVILTITVIAVAWVLATTTTPSSSTAVGSASATPTGRPVTPAPAGSPDTSAAPVITPAASTGPAQVTVPRLPSLSLADARAALAAAGLSMGSVVPQDSSRAGDTVLSASRAAGSSADVGSAIDVVVASGSNGVPVVTGLGQSDAIASIQSAGFAVVVETRVSGSAPAGTVLGAVPAESSSLRLGSSVTIVVATAPAPTPTPTSTPTATPSPSATPHA